MPPEDYESFSQVLMQTARRLSDWEAEISRFLNGRSDALTYVRCYESLESTMDAARADLSSLSPQDKALFLTREQTRGRGRQGRAWAQPQSGFYGTYAFAAPSGIATVAGFSLVVGIAIARIVRQLGAETRLKWPNDVLTVQGAKLSGILIDIVTEKGVPWLLTGIGINLSGEPSVGAATSSIETLTSRKISPTDAACLLTPVLIELWEDYYQKGFAAFKSEWTSLAYGLGGEIVVDTGSEHMQGVFNGVNDRGGLLIERGTVVSEILSGHVLRS